MRSIFRKLESIFAGVAFAEAGDRDTALKIAGLPASRARASFAERLNNTMAAVAFAEANCPEIALEFLTQSKGRKPARQPGFAEAVGLQGIRIWYGVAEVA